MIIMYIRSEKVTYWYIPRNGKRGLSVPSLIMEVTPRGYSIKYVEFVKHHVANNINKSFSARLDV